MRTLARSVKRLLAVVLALAAAPGTSSAGEHPGAEGTIGEGSTGAEYGPAADTVDLLDVFTGDFDGMLARRRIRVLTTVSRTFFFIDRGRQRGIAHDALRELEAALNRKYRRSA